MSPAVKFTQHAKVYLLDILLPVHRRFHITKTRLYKYIENFTNKKKNKNFQMKNSGSFLFSAQNIDYWYLLESPRQDGFYVFEQK